MTILVKVTPDTLYRSHKCKGEVQSSCMIAVALRDLFPNAIVGFSTFSLIKGHCGYTSDFVRNKIGEFDRKSPEQRLLMSPFSFEIEVPEYVINKIGLSQIYKVLSESSTLEHVNK